MAVLEALALSFWYSRQEPPVIYKCSLSIQGEQFLAIVGESGCGKSTLLRLLCGLMQVETRRDAGCKHQLEGKVLYAGNLLDGPSLEFAYVPQDFGASLLPTLTATENVMLALRDDDAVADGEKRTRVEHVMDRARILGVRNTPVRLLSGGQRQRIAICRAIARQPRVLFMDEPFANLDRSLKPSMGEILRTLRDDRGFDLSVVLVSHDLEQACDLADVVVAMVPTAETPRSRLWQRPSHGPVDHAEVWDWVKSSKH